MMDLSPAVERLHDLTRQLANQAGHDQLTAFDWLRALLDDDDSKPVLLFERLGFDLAGFRNFLLTRDDPLNARAPAPPELFQQAREKALSIRGEPTVTTEYVLLALFESQPSLTDRAKQFGVDIAAIEQMLVPDYMASGTEESADLGLSHYVATPDPEHCAALRVVDANLNRAREALRVLDDYARFVLNDAIWTQELKQLRHELAQASERLPLTQLLASRDTPNDVGVDLTTSREHLRDTPLSVAIVNNKRLQESLRSAEEFGKVLGQEFSQRLEQLRYRAYTLEARLVRGTTARDKLQAAHLYGLLTGSQAVCTLDWIISEAAEGGFQVFQLREKNLSDRELLERARRVRRWTRDAGVLFIVNDRPDLAKLVEADGVHLGQDDLPVAAARKILGSEPLIGVSTHNLEQVRQAVLDGADYLGIGPTFPSKTKSFDTLAGLEFIHAASQATSLPLFALGGINFDNLPQVLEAGATRIAVSSLLAESEEPRIVATRLRLALAARRDLPQAN